MAYNPELRIPWGYAQTYKPLAEVRSILLEHYHPEYVRRLLAWLTSKGGTVGIGGTWRTIQPDRPGFAPDGRSFHQNQTYADGFVGACAVDVVAKDGPDDNFSHDGVTWAMVPKQGGAEAAKWGVHANVDQGATPEPWHIQPVEIDGWASWVEAGRPAPRPNYPLPEPATPVYRPTNRPKGTLDMVAIMKYGGTPAGGWQGIYSPDGGTSRYTVRNMGHAALLVALGAVDAKTGVKVTSPTWDGVSHTLDAAEINTRLGTPG